MDVLPPELHSLILYFAFDCHVPSSPCAPAFGAARRRKPAHLLLVSSLFYSLALPCLYHHMAIRKSSDWELLFGREGRLSKDQEGRRLASFVQDLELHLAATIPSIWDKTHGYELISIDLGGLTRVRHLCLPFLSKGCASEPSLLDESIEKDSVVIGQHVCWEMYEEHCQEHHGGDDCSYSPWEDETFDERLDDRMDPALNALDDLRASKELSMYRKLIEGGLKTISACLNDGPTASSMFESRSLSPPPLSDPSTSSTLTLHLFEAFEGDWDIDLSTAPLRSVYSSVRVVFHDMVDPGLRDVVREKAGSSWFWVDGPRWEQHRLDMTSL